MLTYNHERFLEQALESVFAQKTTFDWELVVGDDFSTDGTRALLRSRAQSDPDRVRLLLHPYRLGPDDQYLAGKRNFVATYGACRGEYIAFLDGDDYWTDELKLEQQAAFLDVHPTYSFCCHAAEIEYADDRHQHWPAVVGFSEQETCTIEDILRLDTKPELPMAGMMLRADLLPEFPAWFDEVMNGDYALQVLLADHGEIGFMPACMAVHRKHSGGISRVYDEDPDLCNAMLLELHLALNEQFDFRYRHILDPYIERERELARRSLQSIAREYESAEIAEIVRIPLSELTTHQGTVEAKSAGGVLVTTAPEPWSYAASVSLPAEVLGAISDGGCAYVRVRARVLAGEVGLGVLATDSNEFVDRRPLDTTQDEEDLLLRVPQLAGAAELIVQTWAAPIAASILVEDIDLVVVAEPQVAATRSRIS